MNRRWTLLAALSLLAACSVVDPSPASVDPSQVATPHGGATSAAEATASPIPGESSNASTPFDPFESAPAVVVDRDPLPSCGIEVVERQVDGDRYDADARACFWTAWEEHRAAEFVSVPITVEGGRTTDVYRILPDAGVEIFVDWSGDPSGPHPGWVRIECAGLERRTNAAAPEVPFFEGTGCGAEVELSGG